MTRIRVSVLLALVLALLAPGAALAADPPLNEVRPEISGTARDGQTLASTDGVWSGADSYRRQWRLCDAAGSNCQVLRATSATLLLADEHVGSTLRIRVEATGPGGTVYAESEPSGVVAAIPPNHVAAPVLTGSARVGQVLSATLGTWSGSQPLTYGRQWRRCDATGPGCVSIPGATGAQYTITGDDLGSRIRHLVTGTNAAGADEGSSVLTAPVEPAQPPVATRAPAITGTAMDRQTLTLDRGTWTGATTIAYTQSWLRCNAVTGACLPILATNGLSLALTSADVGARLRAEVTATNPDGTATRSTVLTAVVEPAPPVSSRPPTVSGAARVGQTLTVATDGWTGTPTLGYEFRWRRCLSDGTSCAPVPGATNAAHVLTEDDLDRRLVAVVTATNAAGSGVRESVPTGVVAPRRPPQISAPPVVSGTPRDGQTLTSGNGTWSGTPSIAFSRQWRRCTPDCVDIPGATSTSYPLSPADVGAEIVVRVTATNPDGTASAVSDPVRVAPAPPVATARPGLTGTPRDGEVLTGGLGTWTGTPVIAYTRRWESCRADVCQPIPGATGATLRLSSDHVGLRIQLRVVGTNGAGEAESVSAPTALVAAAPPSAAVAPSASGAARDGETLTAVRGTWTGTVPMTYAYEWRRCTATGASCVEVLGATGETYELGPVDVGRTLRLRVRATNALATVPADSPPTAVVAPLAPSPVAGAGPQVGGRAEDGELLTATPGAWRGTPVLAHAYQWQRCPPPGCEDIAGARSATYRITSADAGLPVRVRVTTTNAGGIATVTSSLTPPVAAVPPTVATPPAVTGTAVHGKVLTATEGSWTGTLPQTRTRAWLRCDTTGGACAPIPGVTGLEYTLAPADVGRTIRIRVTAANQAGTRTVDSQRTSMVAAAPPVVEVAPVVTGLARDASLLSVAPGEWSGTKPQAIDYRWQRCTVATNGAPACTDVEGATSVDYRLRTADVGRRMRALVRAANGGGSFTHTTALTGEVLPSPPENVVRPRLTGTARDGEELTASEGEWTGVVTFAYAYRWFRCAADGTNCGVVAGAEERTYRLTGADTGYAIRAEVVARNPGGATAAFTDHTATSAPSPPVRLSAPAIAGATGVGLELTATDGDWAGSVPMDFTRQWLRCGTEPADACVPIAGETRRAYRLTAADLGHRIGLSLRAANAAGAETATAARTRIVRNDPPVNAASPTVEAPAIAADGARLTATEGDWGDNGPFEAGFRWRRCDATGIGCADIAGATGRSYDLVAADVGSTIRVTVTMDNGVGAAEATSAAVGPIRAAVPTNVVLPLQKAGGALLPGTELTSTPGTWRGGEPMVFAYQWLRCSAGGTDCEPIPGAGDAKYVLAPADVGRTLRARVTATNSTTVTPATSEPSGAVGALPPAAAGKVALTFDGATGKPRIGMRARGEGGSFTGTGPLRHDYRWQRCASASDCRDIPGATAAEHVLTAEDVGRRVRLLVVAENVAGSASLASPISDLVAGTAPAGGRLPSVGVEGGGKPLPGAVLSLDPGDFAGTGPLAYTYSWQRCKPGGKTCKPIPGASGERYTAVAEDVAQQIAVLVTARNPYGKADALSAPSETVAAIAPAAKTRPTLTRPAGTLEAGSILKATPGEWTGTGPLTYGYEWLRCTTTGAKCRVIAKAAKESYVLEAADFRDGRMVVSLRVAVTATNASGSAVQRSLPFGGKGTAGADSAGPTTRAAKPKKPSTGAATASARVARRKLALKITCPKGTVACAGKVTVQGTGLRRTASFKLKPGKSRRRSLRLSAKQRRALTRARRLPVTVTVTGGGAPTVRRVTLRWSAR